MLPPRANSSYSDELDPTDLPPRHCISNYRLQSLDRCLYQATNTFLLEAKNATAGRNSPDLASLYDMLETKLRALESLGRTKEKLADFQEPFVNHVYLKVPGKGAEFRNIMMTLCRCPGCSNSSHVQMLLMMGYPKTICAETVGQGNKIRVRRILDSASSRSYVSDRVIKYLKLKPLRHEKVIYGLFGGKEIAPLEHGIYAIDINDLNGSFKLCSEVFSERKIYAFVPKVENQHILENLKINKIELSDAFCNEDEIDLLLGEDLIGKLLTGKGVQLNFGLAAIHTKLGWTVIFKETGLGSSNDEIVVDSTMETVLSLYVNDISLKELWEIDSIGIRDPTENVSKRKLFDEQLKEFHEKLTVLPDDRRPDGSGEFKNSIG
ncbi:hypothetical protein HNY73_013559 [Argiope bruennichi]|uniref:Peptidase aspartic putative domain-containing protein n=1 Tax=Argiope bruennichi TaxID=94029 RepID=A0A8T0F0J9_ARGBR|nr:hypothetical protein HNY73_013559 [Argiope bruennichi]